MGRVVAHRPADARAGERSGPHPAFRAAVARNEAHPADPLTVPEIARGGERLAPPPDPPLPSGDRDTLTAYVRRRGLGRAHLLHTRPLAVPAIAAAIGIPDPQTFGEACHRGLGASPRAVRASSS
ncbi:hypothetical protein ABZ079_16410 [Streptomyces sp. NPDC006314]|uniref:hypothetical protein n=1 Tax=Streptomyces sp. NPDC006314 TaxID=3154475 RepID=UPI00339F9C98